MFKKFARWILADEIKKSKFDFDSAMNKAHEAIDKRDEANTMLDFTKAQVNSLHAMVADLHDDHLRAEGVISQVFHATEGIKNGTGKKVNRMIRDYYDAP